MNETNHLRRTGIDETTVPLVALSLIALAGMISVLWVTCHGAGLFADSMVYLSGADNLRDGHGYTSVIGGDYSPIIHYPPFFSTTLAVIGFLGIDSYAGSRWVNALAMALNIWLTGYIAGRHLKVSPVGVVFVSLFILTSWQFISIHTWVLSEPIFMCFSLLGLLCLLRQMEAPSGGKLLASVAFFSLALMTRHFGIPLLAAGMLSLLFVEAGPRRQRLIHAAIFGGTAAIPYLFFLVRNRIVGGQATIVTPHNIDLPTGFVSNVFHILANTFALSWPSWLDFRLTTKVLFWCSSVGFLIILLWHMANMRPARWVAHAGRSAAVAVLIFIVCYLCFYIFVTATLANDFATLFHMSRALLPLLPYVVLLLAGIMSESLRSTLKGRFASQATVAAVVLLLVSTLKLGWSFAVEATNEGQGLATRGWRSSETLAFIRTLPKNGLFFSNEPTAIWFYTGRPARWLPETYKGLEGRDVGPGELRDQLNAFKYQLEKRGGWIVYLNQSFNTQFVPAEWLAKDLKLTLVRILQDGVVYTLAN